MSLFEGIAEDLVNMESFWRHSVACGIAAKIIATYRREPNIERFFVAGIVHDIGRLIIFRKAAEEARQALVYCRENSELLHRIEQKIIGVDHCQVGRAPACNLGISRRWGWTEWSHSITLHEAPLPHPAETAIVHVVDIIAHGMRYGTSGEHYVPPLDGKAWELLNLPVSLLSPVLDQLEREAQDIEQTIMGAFRS